MCLNQPSTSRRKAMRVEAAVEDSDSDNDDVPISQLRPTLPVKTQQSHANRTARPAMVVQAAVEWACEVCTLLNACNLNACQLCGSQRPAGALLQSVQPVAAADQKGRKEPLRSESVAGNRPAKVAANGRAKDPPRESLIRQLIPPKQSAVPALAPKRNATQDASTKHAVKHNAVESAAQENHDAATQSRSARTSSQQQRKQVTQQRGTNKRPSRPAHTSRPAHADFVGKPSQLGMSNRPGDWLCSKCNFNVFASKSACLKCGSSRPSSSYLAAADRCRAGSRQDIGLDKQANLKHLEQPVCLPVLRALMFISLCALVFCTLLCPFLFAQPIRPKIHVCACCRYGIVVI